MRRLWIVPIVFAALLVPVAVLAGSGQGSFDSVVSSIEGHYHARATRIPFPALISLISSAATQGGVGGLHVAQFESFSEPVDGEELNRMVAEKLGSGWERMIRETRRKGHEQTLIFVQPEGRRMGLFVVDLNGRELDVVQVSVDPDHLNQSLGQYRHRHDANENGGD